MLIQYSSVEKQPNWCVGHLIVEVSVWHTHTTHTQHTHTTHTHTHTQHTHTQHTHTQHTHPSAQVISPPHKPLPTQLITKHRNRHDLRAIKPSLRTIEWLQPYTLPARPPGKASVRLMLLNTVIRPGNYLTALCWLWPSKKFDFLVNNVKPLLLAFYFNYLL